MADATDGAREAAGEEIAIGALLAVTYMLNPAITEHINATAELARRIAVRLGVSKESAQRTQWAAQLHDIGLNGVDVRILDNESPLTEHEYNICRLHAERGARLVASIPCLAKLAPIVRAHHERSDGSGYPDGLAGEEIPLESRIIAVADVFHAMASAQHWREAVSPFSAIQELISAADAQLDADVVNALVTLLGHDVRQSMTG